MNARYHPRTWDLHRVTIGQQCPPCNGHCEQGRRCPTTLHGRFVDTIPTDHGSFDPIGDDQAERSGFGGLESAAPEGGTFREPSRAFKPAPSSWWPLGIGAICIAIVAACAVIASFLPLLG